MKGLAGGMGLAVLLALAAGAVPMAVVFGIVGGLAAAAAAKDEELREERAASWRANYPKYRY